MYTEDILQNGFEQQTLQLKDDYEGKVVSTLVRRLAESQSYKAVLYIHGFNDYFFQTEMGLRFNSEGYNFYALDLRKYGRSLLPHQKINDTRNLHDYFEEISEAIRIIHDEGNKKLLLLGHSTGGLIVTLFAKGHTGSGLFDGIILNSPFFAFNLPWIEKKIIPVISFFSKHLPSIRIPGGFTELYGKSLRKSFDGEWDYKLEWKPNLPPKVNIGWIGAIYKAQKELQKTFKIKEPVLALHSGRSIFNPRNVEEAKKGDSILNIEDIRRIAKSISGNVKVVSIRNGLHDLILSPFNVRNEVYKKIFDWTKLYY